MSIYIASRCKKAPLMRSVGTLLYISALLRFTGAGFRFLPAGLREAHPCQHCFYSVVQKWVFPPQGRHVTPTNVKFGTGERTFGPLPRAKFHVYRDRNVGLQPPKLSKFRILAIYLCIGDDSFAVFLRNSQRLYASTGSF